MHSELIIKILVCFLGGMGAGLGTGFAGMSAAAVIGPVLVGFLGVTESGETRVARARQRRDRERRQCSDLSTP